MIELKKEFTNFVSGGVNDDLRIGSFKILQIRRGLTFGAVGGAITASFSAGYALGNFLVDNTQIDEWLGAKAFELLN